MRFLFLTLGLFLVFSCFAQKKKANVLSYYAVTNSIDGQPLINERNLLRFYPVFALRDSITNVKVTIYYGSEVFIQSATRFNDGLYWEVKLPEFDLGDAIQRYEVQTDIKYNINIKKELTAYKNLIESKSKEFIDSAEKRLREFNDGYNAFQKKFIESTKKIDEFNVTTGNAIDKLKQSYKSFSTNVKIEDELRQIDSLVGAINQRQDTVANHSKILDEILVIKTKILFMDSVISKISENSGKIQTGYVNAIKDLDSEFINNINERLAPFGNSVRQQKLVAKYIASKEFLIDSLKGNLITKLTDKDFTGIGIQKSDIVFDKEYKNAKILYRNYRIENRTLVALDPAEKLSIFRLRYIPFPVIGSNLEGPAREGIPIVFEAGITFGNQVITSNEFAKPELSIKRLGVAVAFTPQLFAKDAKILALLFSYDFNAYASIGVGANFGTLSINGPDPYFSFGINQKAFQRLVVGIANVFR